MRLFQLGATLFSENEINMLYDQLLENIFKLEFLFNEICVNEILLI